MTNAEKRTHFTSMMARLILHAEMMDLNVAGDDLKRQPTCSHGHQRSTHRFGMAIDLIIYDKDWKPVWDQEPFNRLHDYWDTLGGSRRIEKDLGHFSVEHNGVR